MRLDQLISEAVEQLIGRFVRRAIAAFLLGLFLLAVIYQLTAAGTLVLSDTFGVVNARLIVAGAFAFAALIAFVFLVATRTRKDARLNGIAGQPRTIGIAMLLESVLLGYALARGKPRSTLKRT